MNHPWPLSLAAREGLRGALASGWLRVMVTVTTAYLTASIGIASSLDVSALVAAEREWIRGGGYTFIAEPDPTTPGASLSVARCERLAEVDGVEASFAAQVTDQAAAPSNAPGTRATWVRVSPGIFPFFSLGAPTGGRTLVTSQALEPTGLEDGERTVLTVSGAEDPNGSDVEWVEITSLDSSRLPEMISGSYLSPDLVRGAAQLCVVSVNPGHSDAIAAYIAVALGEGSPATVRRQLPESAYGVDFAAAYGERVLGWQWLAVSTALIALWAAVQHARRGRMAIYATFGAHASARLVIQFVEWLSMTLVGAVWGWALAMAFSIGLGSEAWIAFVQVTANVAAAWCTAGLGTVVIGLVPVGTLLSVLKDR